jgi:hypothetical protein
MHTDDPKGYDRRKPHEGHDAGRDVADSSTPGDQYNPDSPGYETTDVNVNGIVVFLAGLCATLVVFFFVCYGLGKLINNIFVKQDGPPNKWHLAQSGVTAGNLTSNAKIQQEQLQQITQAFPQPQPSNDDEMNQTAQLHAREDLFLEHYSTVDGNPNAIRIPIDRAMQLIAQRGLPVQSQTVQAEHLAHDEQPQFQTPLTIGFARTGYELEQMAAREQQVEQGKAEAAEK